MNAFISLAGLRSLQVRRDGVPSAAAVNAVAPLKYLAKRTLTRRTLLPGESLRCVEGSIWITSDADDRDIILQAGQRHRVERRRCLLIEALEDAILQ